MAVRLLLLSLVPEQIHIRRVNSSVINVSWVFSSQGLQNAVSHFNQSNGAIPVEVSIASSSSFVTGTRLGSLYTNATAIVLAPSTFEDPETFVDPTHDTIYVRITPVPNNVYREDIFAQSLPWMTTSSCYDTAVYLNDTDAIGAPEANVSKWECKSCPMNAVCAGGRSNTWSQVKAKFGTWRVNQDNKGASVFVECLAPQMCLGAPNPSLAGKHFDIKGNGEDLALVENATEGCAESGSGPMCSVCQGRTWRSSAYSCNSCASEGVSVLLTIIGILSILVVLVGTIIVTIYDEKRDTAIDLQMVKIMVNHLVISSSTGKLPLRWGFLQGIFAAFDALSMQFGEGTLSLDCIMYDASNTDKNSSVWLVTAIVAALTPACLVALSAFILLPSKAFWREKLYIDSTIVFKVSMMIILILSHPTITRISVGMFACREIGPTYTNLGVRIPRSKRSSYTYLHVLERDFSFQCDNELVSAARGMLGYPMIILYVVGVPTYYLWRLTRHREHLDHIRAKYGFLLSGFLDTRYYWEIYNTVRKAIFTMVTVLLLPIGPRMQIWGTMCILQIFLVMETWGHPHMNPILNGIEDLALSLDVLQLFCGLGIFFATDEGFFELSTLLSFVILLTNIAFFIYWFYMWWKHSDYKRKASQQIKGLSVRMSRGLSMLTAKPRSEDALLQILQAKRKMNAQRKMERRIRREERQNRRRKTLGEQFIREAVEDAKVEQNVNEQKSKLRRASLKANAASAFLYSQEPERPPPSLLLKKNCEVKLAQPQTPQNRKKKRRSSCFIQASEGNGPGTWENDPGTAYRGSEDDGMSDETDSDPEAEEIRAVEARLFDLLEAKAKRLKNPPGNGRVNGAEIEADQAVSSWTSNEMYGSIELGKR